MGVTEELLDYIVVIPFIVCMGLRWSLVNIQPRLIPHKHESPIGHRGDVGYFLIHLQSSYRVPGLANGMYSVPGPESIILLPSYMTVFGSTVPDKKSRHAINSASDRSMEANKRPDRADRAGRERPVFGRAEELLF